jgi:hypothetical protein
MMMNHLTNDELTEMCLNSDQQRLQEILAALPESARAITEHPDSFWQRQAAQIRVRIAASERQPAWTARAWASALALILLGILLLNRGSVPQASRSDNDSDQELFLAVEQAVHSDVPEALAPAAMLADEINNNVRSSSTPDRVSKENQNEN